MNRLLIKWAILPISCLIFASCSSPQAPIMRQNGSTLPSSIVPLDAQNSYDWIGNIHTNGLDYISTHYSFNRTDNSWANDFYTHWLSDSLTQNSGTYEHWVDSAASWSAFPLRTWNAQALAVGGISMIAKAYLDQVANVFDSLNIYDSATIISRVTQIDNDVNTNVTDSADKQAILSVLSIGRASYLYWTYQFKNPTISKWPVSQWSNATSKKGVPNSLRSGSRPLLTQRQVNIIDTDLEAAGASLAKDIAVTVFTTIATGGTATIPTTTYVAMKALATGLGASAWYGLWH